MIKTARINHTIKNHTTIHVETCPGYCLIKNNDKITKQCPNLEEIITSENFYCKIRCRK